MDLSSQQKVNHKSRQRTRQHSKTSKQVFGNAIDHAEIARVPEQSKSSALEKRKRNTSRDTSRASSRPPVKHSRLAFTELENQLCQMSTSSDRQLCDVCSKIPWDDWKDYEKRLNWAGIPLMVVAKHYRNVSSSTTCPLCRQLHAPWIELFVQERAAKNPRSKDLGDAIHVFLNLRHLPHVNDFPGSREVLREYDSPWHVAVVPLGGKWKAALREHLASNGMVIAMPKGADSQKLFAPRHVSADFDPSLVKEWRKCCQHHHSKKRRITRCIPKTPDPEVKGMRVIDCQTDDFVIVDYPSGEEYVALSYVWGYPARSEMPLSIPVLEGSVHGELLLQSTSSHDPRNPLQERQPNLNLIPRQSLAKPIAAMKNSETHRTAVVTLKKKTALMLPKSIPLTIRDAIQVTKALGYRYLWVDKYCIDQENEDERKLQCGRMGDIYAGSQVTIFALGPDSNYGLPGVSSRARLEQREHTKIGDYDFVSTVSDPHWAIEQSKWSTRGWTYQEGLFSTRRLFFTDHQVYWECNSMNCVESFKSNLQVLHILTGERYRAFHRAGKFVCGNSNSYSHVQVGESETNHRKTDTIRRCQHQIQQYSKRELTYDDDILEAFAGIARFYARTTAKILSLAGIPVPSPLANLSDNGQERLNHLSFALGWAHYTPWMAETELERLCRRRSPPLPQYDTSLCPRRNGFPSWSWAGWFGELRYRKDIPSRWTSYLCSVKIGFREGVMEDYGSLENVENPKGYFIRKLLMANVLVFDAYVLDPQRIQFWANGEDVPPLRVPSSRVQIYLSKRIYSRRLIRQRLVNERMHCVVLGRYGRPSRTLFNAILAGDKKSRKYKNQRIELLLTERGELPDALICLLVEKTGEEYHRVGLLKIKLVEYQAVRDFSSRSFALEDWGLREKRTFRLV